MASDDRELSLIDLAPERLVFRDEAFGGDGARHEYRMAVDLGLESLAQMRRIQDELTRAYAALTSAAASADEIDQAAQRIQAGLDAFLRLVLPTLPAERVTAIPLRGKERIMDFWRTRQPHEEAAPGAPLPAAPATAPRKRSRGSSQPTA